MNRPDWNPADIAAYGQFTSGRAFRTSAHRFAYEDRVGPIPAGLTIDHLCKTPACVNPSHLEAVTMQENLRRSNAWSAVNSRKECCPQGHEHDRLRRRTNGRFYRECSTCHNAAQRTRRSAKRKDRAA